MGKIEREIYIITNYNWDISCPDVVSSYEEVVKYFQEECGDFNVEEIPNDITFDDLDEIIGDAGYSLYKHCLTFHED